MSYVYINREIYPNQLVQDDPLDDNYAKGYSYDDYINGNPAPWIELGEEQLAFKEANPKATVKEIIEAKLDDSRLLNEEKMSEFLHREGGRYWTTIDGVRQLYRRIECKMCFEVIEKLRGL